MHHLAPGGKIWFFFQFSLHEILIKAFKDYFGNEETFNSLFMRFSRGHGYYNRREVEAAFNSLFMRFIDSPAADSYMDVAIFQFSLHEILANPTRLTLSTDKDLSILSS